ncbi:MAG: hypothetical protein IPJ82_13925 [Lewinellaceae bacterium]|nr:hypothetical protein [Lewinellaceae bacterium]
MAKIKKVQVADPAVSFQLDLTGHISQTQSLPNLTVALTITNPDGSTRGSVLNLNSPIFDSSNNSTLDIVMPYGDVVYPAGREVKVSISAFYVLNGVTHQVDTVSDLAVVAQSGKFIVSVG